MALHEQSVGATDEWYTPAYVFEAMGLRFDLDVSHPEVKIPATEWCAALITSRSLDRPWFGTVWMNPPFGGRNGIAPWLAKFFDHGNGVALVPDRTSAPWWQTYAPKTDRLLFVARKIRFLRPDGTEGASPAQGTVLMAKGAAAVAALERAEAAGLGLCFSRPEDDRGAPSPRPSYVPTGT